MNNNFVWMDGRMIPASVANISVFSNSLHYGSGVFEGERAYNGKIFKMQEHHERLHKSAQLLDMEIPYSVDILNVAAMEVLLHNDLKNAYVRPIAWFGDENLTLSTKKLSVHVAIMAWEWGSYFKNQKGIKLMWSDWVRPSSSMIPSQAKATGMYIVSSLGKNKAESLGFDDCLMLDYRGFVSECTGANIFMVKDGKLFTPIADNFLDGITRQTIIKLARDLSFSCEEKRIFPDELLRADEIFVTGSAAEVTPVSCINEHMFDFGKITKKLQKAYFNLVNS